MISPNDFIHIAEETGLIIPIGSWVLGTVCEQLARWPEAIHVSANVSPVQLRPQLVEEVRRLLTRHRFAPDRLVLEITESLVLDPHTKPIVISLRELGVQLALDDFGTGYSSLGSLQRFPLDVLKLDRTLISSIDEGGGSAIVRAAIELGRALDVAVIAEGIEGPQQLSGCAASAAPSAKASISIGRCRLPTPNTCCDKTNCHPEPATDQQRSSPRTAPRPAGADPPHDRRVLPREQAVMPEPDGRHPGLGTFEQQAKGCRLS